MIARDTGDQVPIVLGKFDGTENFADEIKISCHYGSMLKKEGGMGWRGIRVTGRHVGSSEGKLPLILFYRCCSVVLAHIIFLMPVEAGGGMDGWTVSVPISNRTFMLTEDKGSVEAVEEPVGTSPTRGGKETGLSPNSATDSPQRTSRSLVNTVMALLATFDEAGVLPPEGTAQANQIIHALIQLQSAVVKTSDPELQRFLSEAIRVKVGDNWEETYRSIPHTGLTSVVVEALMTYASQSSMWTQPGVVLAFRQFNVTEDDWLVIETIFFRARDVYGQQGVSIHDAFSAWLKKVP
ncbi:MAG: hypothetical protein AB7T38_03170 [Nitrospirales bacterium]